VIKYVLKDGVVEMGHSRNKKKNTNKAPHSRSAPDKTSDIKQKINEETVKEQLLEIRQKNRENNLKAVEKTIYQIFRIAGIIAFGIVLVVTFLLVIWCIVLYCQGNNTIATIVVTVIQLVTGILSLAVGVWALILTIQSNRDTAQIHSRNMNINTSYAKITTAGIRENDVNENSLR